LDRLGLHPYRGDHPRHRRERCVQVPHLNRSAVAAWVRVP
jgi:hypothetical protein